MNYQVSQPDDGMQLCRSDRCVQAGISQAGEAMIQGGKSSRCVRLFQRDFAFVVRIIATMLKNPLPSVLTDSNLSERSGSWPKIPLSNDTFRHIFGWVILVQSIGVIQGLDLGPVSRFAEGFLLNLGVVAHEAIRTATLSCSAIKREVVATTLTVVILLRVSDWITQVFQSKASPTLFLAKKTGT